ELRRRAEQAQRGGGRVEHEVAEEDEAGRAEDADVEEYLPALVERADEGRPSGVAAAVGEEEARGRVVEGRQRVLRGRAAGSGCDDEQGERGEGQDDERRREREGRRPRTLPGGGSAAPGRPHPGRLAPGLSGVGGFGVFCHERRDTRATRRRAVRRVGRPRRLVAGSARPVTTPRPRPGLAGWGRGGGRLKRLSATSGATRGRHAVGRCGGWGVRGGWWQIPR